MRNRKQDRDAAEAAQREGEGGTPVRGFVLTARVEGSQYPNTQMTGWEGIPIYTVFHKPVVLEVTIRNTSDQVLWYFGYGPRNPYVVDVRYGPARRGTAEAVTETGVGRAAPPYTQHGSRMYRPLAGAISLFSRFTSEIEPGASTVVYILVDKIYDLTVDGLYRITVRHLFPLQQS
ncbi:MAG: hypothetical protein V4671_08450, partial [Armatimonadota bacterium]